MYKRQHQLYFDRGIHYAEVCTWYGALRFAELTNNKELIKLLRKDVYKRQLNTQLFFDPRTKQITNNEFANAMLAGLPPRKGWDEFYKL